MSPIERTPDLRAAFSAFLERWAVSAPSSLPREEVDRRTEAAARRILNATGGKARGIRFFDSPMEIHRYVADTFQRWEKEKKPAYPSRRLPDPLRKAAVPLFLKTLASSPPSDAKPFREAFREYWLDHPLGVYVLREVAPQSHRSAEFLQELVIPEWLNCWKLPLPGDLSVFLQAAFLYHHESNKDFALADDFLWLGGNTLYLGWFYKELWICRAPVEIHFGDNHRLHRTDAPAVRFANGHTLAYIDGVAVPSRIFDRDHQLTAHEILRTENQEVRRVFLERLGLHRFLQELAAEEVEADDFGVLYRVLPGERNRDPLFDIEESELRFVKVKNSTPEPGTEAVFKEYLLQVPEATRTPREAVAWSFGLSEQDYFPLQET